MAKQKQTPPEQRDKSWPLLVFSDNDALTTGDTEGGRFIVGTVGAGKTLPPESQRKRKPKPAELTSRRDGSTPSGLFNQP